MAIKTSQGFKITSNEAVDANLTLTKLEMKNIDENLIPDKYLTICQDDGKLYLYNKGNSVDETTGKFRVFEGGGSDVRYADLPDKPQINNVELTNNKTSSDLKLQPEMAAITNQEIDTIIFG